MLRLRRKFITILYCVVCNLCCRCSTNEALIISANYLLSLQTNVADETPQLLTRKAKGLDY